MSVISKTPHVRRVYVVLQFEHVVMYYRMCYLAHQLFGCRIQGTGRFVLESSAPRPQIVLYTPAMKWRISEVARREKWQRIAEIFEAAVLSV